MSKYVDPDNVKEILTLITTKKTFGEIYDMICTIFPGWIISFADNYSKDYKHLSINWSIFSKEINTNPAQIVIVDELYQEDQQHVLIQIFTEIFTKCGFQVRTKDDLILCKICHLAIPSQRNYIKMKELNLDVPEIWKDYCTTCHHVLG